jgi:hypothetical protein
MFHLSNDALAAAGPDLWQVFGALLLLSPLVAIAIVLLDEAGRERPAADARPRTRSGAATASARRTAAVAADPAAPAAAEPPAA